MEEKGRKIIAYAYNTPNERTVGKGPGKKGRRDGDVAEREREAMIE